MLFLLSFLSIATPAFATDPLASVTLPESIITAQILLVSQGECEGNWRTIVDPKNFPLGNGYQLWIVGCANWSYNVDATAYLTIREDSQPSGYLTKQLFFLNYSPYQHLYAENVVHNVQFNPTTLTLTAEFFFQANAICGARSLFNWNQNNQNFNAKEIWKQDDCKNPDAPWIQVYGQ